MLNDLNIAELFVLLII